MRTLRINNIVQSLLRGSGGIAVLLAVSAIPAAHAQSRNPGSIACLSTDGRRTFCDADTSGGVRFERQLGDTKCEQDFSWGYTDRGVWVDRGCRAELSLLSYDRRRDDRDRNSFTTIQPGTVVTVRTNQYINSSRADGRIFTGVVNDDVLGDDRQLAIPRGSNVELIVRVAPDNDLILDMESVTINGQRYAINADSDRIEARDGVGTNRRTGEYVGGGALLGTIIGAIAGGGKGAAIGAAAGAGAGAISQTVTRGREVRVPAESLLTFRIERPMQVGLPDTGVTRDGYHYHQSPYEERNR